MQPKVELSGSASVPPPKDANLASKDFEDFIYLISHDVRASVRALIELPQWIAEDLEEAGIPIEGSLATSMDLMNRHTGRLDRMLVDLLTYSRVGRMQDVREVHPDRALDQVLEEITVPSGFQILRNIQCDTVRLGDRDILTLLGALVQNAIRHHDRDTGRIVINVVRDGQDIVLGVADDGPGIEDTFRDKVFDAMRTLRPRDEVEGSGMGLANVRKIASLYNGIARVTDSPYGRGTLVEVRLKGQFE